MTESKPDTFTAFAGTTLLSRAARAELAVTLSTYEGSAPLRIWCDRTGREIDLDLRGTPDEIRQRYAEGSAPRGRGRPKLGVVAKEITLLPRHWEWLSTQSGGASATLRRLVEAARKEDAAKDGLPRARIDAAWQFMESAAGDLPHFEEVSRALYAGKLARVEEGMADWPADIAQHVIRLIDHDPA